MKTKRHSHHFLTPLAGPICALLAVATLTPLLNSPQSYAAESSLQYLAKKVKMPASSPDNANNNNNDTHSNRTSEESLAAGLKYLLAQQHADGGWGQGGGWRQANSRNGGGRVEGPNVEDPSDLGNTSASVVTLLRAGESPTEGQHRDEMKKAFDYICKQVEKADENSLYVTDVRDTQLQVKIGTYVDTFLAGWALSEIKGRLPDEAAEKRRAAALDKVVGKIAHNQRADGSFANNNGWASVISQGLCNKALNSAARNGANVTQETLDKAQKQNLAGLDVSKGSFSAPASTAAEPSSAGVSLYREAAKWNGLVENSRSNVARKEAAEKTIADASAPPPAKAQAQKDLDQIASDDKATRAANDAVASKLSDTRYVAGFGNNGGEEYLSYMNVTEGMHERGGKEWEDWRAKMTKTVCGAQNEDGSWAGQHCITGRTFCTATALLTLLIEKDKANAGLSGTNPNTPAAPVAVK